MEDEIIVDEIIRLKGAEIEILKDMVGVLRETLEVQKKHIELLKERE